MSEGPSERKPSPTEHTACAGGAGGMTGYAFPKPLTSVLDACLLLAQHFVRFGVDLLFVRCAQFALVLHLGRPSLGIPRVTFVGHWIFAFLRQPEFLGWLGLLLRGRQFCHRTSPTQDSCTQGSNATFMTSGEGA
jgi:hypothetical protein